eukprot:5972244-Amphidinium_carterae.1
MGNCTCQCTSRHPEDESKADDAKNPQKARSVLARTAEASPPGPNVVPPRPETYEQRERATVESVHAVHVISAVIRSPMVEAAA